MQFRILKNLFLCGLLVVSTGTTSFAMEAKPSGKEVGLSGAPVEENGISRFMNNLSSTITGYLKEKNYQKIEKIFEIFKTNPQFKIEDLCFQGFPVKPMKGFLKRSFVWGAVFFDDPEALELFIRLGMGINDKDLISGRTPLHYAVKRGALRTARFLIDNGAFLNAQDTKGITPLILAAGRENLQLVEMLVDAGACLDIPGHGGYTPLAFAVYRGFEKILCFLISRGACVNFEADDGDTPLTLACIGDAEALRPNPRIAALLVRAGARVTERLACQVEVLLENDLRMRQSIINAIGLRWYKGELRPPQKVLTRFAGAEEKSLRVAADLLAQEEAQIAAESAKGKKQALRRRGASSAGGASAGATSLGAGSAGGASGAARDCVAPGKMRACAEEGASSLEVGSGGAGAASAAERDGAAEAGSFACQTIFLGADYSIDFAFRESDVERSNRVNFSPEVLGQLAAFCDQDTREERLGALLSGKSANTAGGFVPWAPRIHKQCCVHVRIMPGPELTSDVVDHALSGNLLVKALVNGLTYLSQDETDPDAQECLLVVAPIRRVLSEPLSAFETTEKNYLTICFEVQADGKIGHCYHFCTQMRHPDNIAVDGKKKYTMRPVSVNASVKLVNRARNLSKLELEINRKSSFGGAGPTGAPKSK